MVAIAERVAGRALRPPASSQCCCSSSLRSGSGSGGIGGGCSHAQMKRWLCWYTLKKDRIACCALKTGFTKPSEEVNEVSRTRGRSYQPGDQENSELRIGRATALDEVEDGTVPKNWLEQWDKPEKVQIDQNNEKVEEINGFQPRDGDKLVDLREIIRDEKILAQLEGVPQLIPLKDIDFEALDELMEEEYSESDENDDGFEISNYFGESVRKRGRVKGVTLSEENKEKIRTAMLGNNTYKRSLEHRSKIANSMRRLWRKRRKGLKPARKITVQCSNCGQMGHNKRTCPKLQNSVSKPNTRTCSFCRQEGHNVRTCPVLAEVKKRRAEGKQENAAPTNDEAVIVQRNDEEEAVKVFPVPVKITESWRQAFKSSIQAWKDGIRRQTLELQLPMSKARWSLDAGGWPGGILQQFRVAKPIVESILMKLKTEKGLEGRLEARFLDKADAIGCWESKNIAAVLFPQSDTINDIRSLDRGFGGERLVLLVNPQWQPGQIVSDFGFGVSRQFREEFVNSFDTVFFQKEISIFDDKVILLRCYPGDWQIHLVKPSGEITLVGVRKYQPKYEELLKMLKTVNGTMTQLNWIDRLQAKYNPMLKKEWNNQTSGIAGAQNIDQKPSTDIEIDAEVSSVLNQNSKGDLETPTGAVEDEMQAIDDFDIITGQAVRDLKLDPVRQFTSLFSRKSSADEPKRIRAKKSFDKR